MHHAPCTMHMHHAHLGREVRADELRVVGAEIESEAEEEEEEARPGGEACAVEGKLALGGLGGVGDLHELAVGPLEDQLQVGHRRRVAILEADEQTLLDHAELGRPLRKLLTLRLELRTAAQVLVDELKVLLPQV